MKRVLEINKPPIRTIGEASKIQTAHEIYTLKESEL
jgi:hypothetical protein